MLPLEFLQWMQDSYSASYDNHIFGRKNFYMARQVFLRCVCMAFVQLMHLQCKNWSLIFHRYNIKICIYGPKEKKRISVTLELLKKNDQKHLIHFETGWMRIKKIHAFFDPGGQTDAWKYVCNLKNSFWYFFKIILLSFVKNYLFIYLVVKEKNSYDWFKWNFENWS